MSYVCFYFAMICGPSSLSEHWQPCPNSQAEEFVFVHMPLGQGPGTDGQAGFPLHVPIQRAPPFFLQPPPLLPPPVGSVLADPWVPYGIPDCPRYTHFIWAAKANCSVPVLTLGIFPLPCPFSRWSSLTTSSIIKLNSGWQQQSVKSNTASFWECALCVTVKLHTQ